MTPVHALCVVVTHDESTVMQVYLPDSCHPRLWECDFVMTVLTRSHAVLGSIQHAMVDSAFLEFESQSSGVHTF